MKFSELAPIPDWLPSKLSAPIERPEGGVAPIGELDTESAIGLASHYLQHDAEPAIENAGGDATTFMVAARATDFGLSPGVCLNLMAEHYNPRCEPPWDLEDLSRKVDNAARYRKTPPGIANPANEFEPVVAARAWVTFGEGRRRALTNTRPLIKGLLDSAALSVVFGQPNAGKSYIVLDWAWRIATGTPWMGRKVAQGVAVYVAMEGARGLFKRLEALKRKHDTPDDVPLVIIPQAFNLRSADGVKRLLGILKEIEAEIGPIVFLAIDTLVAALAGGSDTDPSDMGLYLKHAAAIQAATGAHVCTVHHAGKDIGRGARGWSGLLGTIDTEIEVHDNTVRDTKQRDLEKVTSAGFKLESLHLGVDADGDPVTACVVNYVTAPEFDLELTPAEEDMASVVEEIADGKTPNPAGETIVTLDEIKVAWYLKADKNLCPVVGSKDAIRKLADRSGQKLGWKKHKRGQYVVRSGQKRTKADNLVV
ncbi:MAG: AAA family ATPase [Luteitalea sp.]|nr:AAA family ATPase [Luteitalea sp.]